jgi:acyl-CoA synthetase (NDP forming)
MPSADLPAITQVLQRVAADGRARLYEHECYDLLARTGAEAAPAHRLITPDRRPRAADLAAIPGDKVVLKVVSPDITHKTEARGVRIVACEVGAVEAAFELMLREVPEAYAAYLDAHPGHRPSALRGLHGQELAEVLSRRLLGILLCSFVEADAHGFATELFVGIRSTAEFGPVITAGLGGVEMEILAAETRPGAAVVIAPTGATDGARFLELFRQTLSYQRLTGLMRGSRRLVDDAVLEECFQAFVDVANHFSAANPDAPLHVRELEVNPFSPSGGRLAPLDGVCSFDPAAGAGEPRPLAKIAHLLRPGSAAVIGVSERGMNMGRIILNNLFDAGFDRDRAYVVRPGSHEIDGARCVPTIADLPEKVDLFVVAIGAAQVPDVVHELIEHDRANAVILIPGGLGEKEGSQDLERELKQRIVAAHRTADGGPVFLGGNSLGVISHPGRYDTMFIPETKLAKSRDERERRACFISQSGAFIIANTSRMPWLDPAYALSIGNQIDLTASDLLSYIKDDPAIEVFAVYMEGFQHGDGLAFANAVADTVALGKEVVFYKAGRTREGRSATAGHTASVAGDYAVCEAAVSQAGAMVATDFNEFSDLLNLAVHLRGKIVGGTGLAAVSNAGFESVGMADSIRHGRAELRMVRFTDPTAEALQASLAEHRLDRLVDVKNPLDVTPMATDAAYAELIGKILADDGVHVVVAGVVPLTPAMQTLDEGRVRHESIENPGSIANRLPAIASAHRKPVVAVIDSGVWFDPLADRLQAGGLPVFRSADRAVRVLCRYVDLKLAGAGANPAT